MSGSEIGNKEVIQKEEIIIRRTYYGKNLSRLSSKLGEVHTLITVNGQSIYENRSDWVSFKHLNRSIEFLYNYLMPAGTRGSSPGREQIAAKIEDED